MNNIKLNIDISITENDLKKFHKQIFNETNPKQVFALLSKLLNRPTLSVIESGITIKPIHEDYPEGPKIANGEYKIIV